MKFELELSPTLINQTAMVYIGKDAANALEGLDLTYCYFGETKSQPVDIASDEANRFRASLNRLLETTGHGGLSTIPSAGKGARNLVRRLFLDPLYVLFYDLREEDVVMILDMSTVTSPAWHTQTVLTLYERAFAKIAAVQPQLIAISQNTKDTFHANYGYPRRDIVVIPLYVPEHLLKSSASMGGLKRDRPYFLFVGSLEARKNVAGAIAAFGLSGLSDRGYDFILVGGQGHGFELAYKAAASTPNILFAGKVSNDDLSCLYAGATGFIYPSYLEGFGVPLLEALRYGLPAVSSITGACPEVGGNLVTYCDPDDHAAIAEQIIKIADLSIEDRAAFVLDAKQRATKQFTKAAFQAAFRQVAENI